MNTAEEIEATKHSRRSVTLFAGLVLALGWAGVFDADPVPFDTTSSDAQLPPLAAAAAFCGENCVNPADLVGALAFTTDGEPVDPMPEEPGLVVLNR